MKIKKNYELKKVLDDYMVIPTGDEMMRFSGTLILSETAACVWEKLKQGVSKEDLIDSVLSQYDVSREEVTKDLEQLLEQLDSYHILSKS